MTDQLSNIKRSLTKINKKIDLLEARLRKDQQQNIEAHTNIIKRKYELEDELKATSSFKNNIKQLLGDNK